MPRIVTFDLEIQKPPEECSRGWNSHDEMGISVLCGWDGENPMRFFDEQSLYTGIEYLLDAPMIAGFNSKRFDLAVIVATLKRLYPHHAGLANALNEKPHLDLLEVLIQSIYNMPFEQARALHGNAIFKGGRNLDTVARQTLGVQKSGNGAHAPLLWRQGRIAELYDYCANDVWLTHRLVQFARTQGYLCYGEPRQSNALLWQPGLTLKD